MSAKLPLIFALHATARGFAYVAFEGPFTPHDWGTVVVRGDKNAVCLRRLVKLLDRLEPECFLLEEPKSVANRSDRITRLYKAVGAICAARSIELAVYRLSDIKACFRSVGAITRQEIAEAVARQIPAFEYSVPLPRKAWDGASRRMAPFCAAALVLTHYQLGANRLFDDLCE
jgi:Holliday junction resolvasome RuvABC endonuclease subunit